MLCPTCSEALPDGARFCSVCGTPADRDDVTVGATAATRAPRRGLTRTPPSPAPVSPAPAAGSGWLTSSDSINHGRFAPGAVLDGRYRIIGMLGKGGMGEVYRADDLRLGQPVALKLLPESLRHDAQRLAQFHNEVRTARQVSHPNICRVYDIGETNGLLYLSMEYVDGEDLASSLRRIGRFPEDKAADIARQLCAGLAAAHQRGVVHRDLKPANVMLDGAGRVRVMDFGLAAVGQVDDVRAGTPAYMAPEQLAGREVSSKSDIFSLGLVLYELFTGRRAFTAATINDLVGQHEARAIAPPSTIVTALDPAIDRAIMRCLEFDVERRPSSTLAVAAAFPGGDPLAAALAAGETPSPEMVAAAGEGAGLDPRIAWTVFAAIVAGTIVSLSMSVGYSPLEQMRPQLSADVLAQKARDVVAAINGPERAADEAYGFGWDADFVSYIGRTDDTPLWNAVFTSRPSALQFWYRRSPQPLTALMFHSDLLTPGIVRPDDPPPILSGMTHVELDHEGRLTRFESIPPELQETPTRPAPADWSPLLALAALDQTALAPAEPLWTWLAAADTRAAWTGVWPGGNRPLRVEAAALGGRPVAFMATGPWERPSRMVAESSSAGETALPLVLFALAFFILGGAALLARRNLRDGRGDRRGAMRLAACMFAVLMVLWISQVHLAASGGFLAMFLLAVATSVFYGTLIWTIYVALEPFVRRYWPQVLVSSTNVLTGRARDPVVGRDVLAGTLIGVAIANLIRGVDLWNPVQARIGTSMRSFPGALALLDGLRPTLGVLIEAIPYALRNALLYFFLLFVLRVLLRRRWAGAMAFAAVFGVLNALDSDQPLVDGVAGFVYFGLIALAVLRWGLVAQAVAAFVATTLLNVPPTLETSAWFFGHSAFLVIVVVALSFWAMYTSTGGRLWRSATMSDAAQMR